MNKDQHGLGGRPGTFGHRGRTRRSFLRAVAVSGASLSAASLPFGRDAHAAAPTRQQAEAQFLAALDAARTPVPIWWRHDDVGVDSPAFARVLELAQRRQAPIALAVVPKNLKAACVTRILACPQATVVQHGIAHKNNALTGKQVELGGTADRRILAEQLGAGLKQLRGAFGSRFLAMQVPPWNRLDADVVPTLPGLGFTALSTAGKRRSAEPVPGLRQVNIHLDLYKWAAPRGNRSYEEILTTLTTFVRNAKGEPIGFLTHHSVMDEAAFAILDRLLALLQQKGSMRMVRIESLVQNAR